MGVFVKSAKDDKQMSDTVNIWSIVIVTVVASSVVIVSRRYDGIKWTSSWPETKTKHHGTLIKVTSRGCIGGLSNLLQSRDGDRGCPGIAVVPRLNTVDAMDIWVRALLRKYFNSVLYNAHWDQSLTPKLNMIFSIELPSYQVHRRVDITYWVSYKNSGTLLLIFSFQYNASMSLWRAWEWVPRVP